MARKTGSHSDITGPKVRDAALRLFSKHGYASVSMRQIAAEVGVQAGALYLYSPNKQSMLFDLLHDQMSGAVAALEATDLSGDPMQQINAFVRCHLQFHMVQTGGFFIPYSELRNLTPKNYKQLEPFRRSYEARLEEILRVGKERGVFDIADTKLTTLVLISTLNGVLAWYKPGGRVRLDQLEGLYSDMVSKSIGVRLGALAEL